MNTNNDPYNIKHVSLIAAILTAGKPMIARYAVKSALRLIEECEHQLEKRTSELAKPKSE